jgi:uncharacterized damage-inducible protein DinB
MSATDPFIDGARDLFIQTMDDLRPHLEGIPPEALNWRPGDDDTNSIAVLAVHAMASTRSWLSVAVGAPLPDRDRPMEFRATAEDASALLAHVTDMERQCDGLLEHAEDVDWSAMRRTHPRPRPGAEETVSGAWALLHALEHLREHAGQIALTRQLWDQRTPS